MKQVKQNSSRWVNQQNMTEGKFSWQEGYGAFSYSKNQMPRLIKYIQNQREHHRTKTFREEYLALLKKYNVDYDERYIFNPIRWYIAIFEPEFHGTTYSVPAARVFDLYILCLVENFMHLVMYQAVSRHHSTKKRSTLSGSAHDCFTPAGIIRGSASSS